MHNQTLIVALGACATLAFLFTALLDAVLSGRDLGPALAFSFLVSLLPAFGAYLVLKLTNIFVSWWGAVIVYFAMFVLVVILQAFGRLIPVS